MLFQELYVRILILYYGYIFNVMLSNVYLNSHCKILEFFLGKYQNFGTEILFLHFVVPWVL